MQAKMWFVQFCCLFEELDLVGIFSREMGFLLF